MFDTNTVLNIAFSIIAHFTNAVYVPPEAVPQSADDLAAYHIGRRYFPCDIYLKHKRGTEFWIAGGSVETYYDTPHDFFGLQDAKFIPQFIGTAKLSSNEVFQLASDAILKLTVEGHRIQGITPLVRQVKPYNGHQIPFYYINWPNPGNPQVFSFATVGIDARNGQIVSLNLSEFKTFDNPIFFQQISNVVFADTNLYGEYERQINFVRYGTNVPKATAISVTNSALPTTKVH